MQIENLGPADRILDTMKAYTDHLYHNRTGMVTQDPSSVTGVRWHPVTYRADKETGVKTVFRLDKAGKKTTRTPIGTLGPTGVITGPTGAIVGTYREAGVFPEVAAWVYGQVVAVWRLDNEFAARWASYSFSDKATSRDFKVLLAAFMLVQSRKGDPVVENGTVVFHDDDFRDVGEAMLLTQLKDHDFNAKLLLRVREVLTLPAIAAMNRELGFGKSPRDPFLGRWPKAVGRWLRYREQNPKVLDGLVRSGNRKMVIRLAKCVGYRPEGAQFFKTLRWEQKQASDGRRSLAIGEKVTAGESWADLTEMQICERIVRDRPDFKRIVGLVPNGLTRAIVAAAIEASCLSNKDLIILTPTLEDLGLLKVQEVKARWEEAVRKADDQRAANIARNVQSKETRETLEEGANRAVAAVVEEAVRNIRVYFMIDISSSMQVSLTTAKTYLEKFLGGFPLEQIHIAVFNTMGRVVTLKSATAAGVRQAFTGIAASGGTDYGSGVRVLQSTKPKQDEDVLFIFVGDEEATEFSDAVRLSGLNPMAFGFIKVGGSLGYNAVTDTATRLRIPCFRISEDTFSDPYAIPRVIRNLIASTPVGQGRVASAVPARVSLVEMISKVPMLKKPTWATA